MDTSTQVPGVQVTVTGDLDAWTTVEVYQSLQHALATRPRQLVIDLGPCTAIDTAGILLLLDTHRRASQIGCVVVLRSPSPPVRRELLLAQLDVVMRCEVGV